ncbi:MAG: mechanosensitive ion channel [Acidobacteriota bacterium]|nr:mechanosensitive ion channel [Acidobacteriota bacterium]
MRNILRHVSQYRISATALLVTLAFVAPVIGQQSENSNSDSATETQNASPTPTPSPAPTPIPVSDINARAEETRLRVEGIQKGLVLSPAVLTIQTSLPELTKELDARTAESRGLMTARPSLETLKTIEQDWQVSAKSLPAWKSELKSAIDGLEKSLAELETLRKEWALTLELIEAPQKDQEGTGSEKNKIEVPAEVLSTVRSMIAITVSTEKKVKETIAEVLSLQTRVSKQDNRVAEMFTTIADRREDALSNLFVRESPPIWSANRTTSSFGEMFTEAGRSYRIQFNTIRDYVSDKIEAIALHVLIFFGFAGILLWARKKARPLVEKDPEIRPAYSVFELPVAGALVLAVMLSGRFYPQAPRMMMAILGAAALVPGVLYLRRILEKPLYPVFNALIVFYLVDLLRQITATLPFLSRIMFTAEMLGAIAFLAWYLWSRAANDDRDIEYQDIFLIIRKAIPVLIVLFSVALIASVFGYVGLSHTVGNSVLASSYSAIILYATVQIVKSLLVFALRIRPFSQLGMVQHHLQLIKSKCFRLLDWVGIISWILLTLNLFSIRRNVFGYLGDWLSYEISLGSVTFTASDILVFGFTIWLSFAISRLVRFFLEEDVYPRVKLGSGISYATSTILHYVLLVVGVLLAIAAIGIDLTNFTILAGAFGVGLGFGMQAIVSNFVSGLILLFERPVELDDFVQVGAHQGLLKKIGLRASVLRTLDGSEIILPNSQLITEEVTNWTFSDQERRLEINIGVAYGTDPRRVMEILNELATKNVDILSEPPPRSIFVGFGESSLDFQLRAWTDKADQWVVVQSDLTLAIHDALKEAEIEIPFPQRDLHVRGLSAEAAKALTGEKNEN